MIHLEGFATNLCHPSFRNHPEKRCKVTKILQTASVGVEFSIRTC